MPAQVQLNFLNLETSPLWTPAVGTDIAPNEPDAFRIESQADGMRLYTIASKPYAGWMARISLPLPALPPQFTASLSMDVKVDDGVDTSMQALELDTMMSMADGRVGNTSFELDIKSGGHAQVVQVVDSKYKWQDIGFNPGTPAADIWAPFRMDYAYDQTAGVSSVTKIYPGSVGTIVPTNFQKVPFQSLAWAKNRFVIQCQSNMVQAGGACSFKIRNVTASVGYNL